MCPVYLDLLCERTTLPATGVFGNNFETPTPTYMAKIWTNNMVPNLSKLPGSEAFGPFFVQIILVYGGGGFTRAFLNHVTVFALFGPEVSRPPGLLPELSGSSGPKCPGSVLKRLESRFAVYGSQGFESPPVRSDFNCTKRNRKPKTVWIAAKPLLFFTFMIGFKSCDLIW